VQSTLRAFLSELEQRGELRRVRASVDPLLEVSEMSQRMALVPASSASASASRFDPLRAALGGQALLFESVEGCDFPLCMNVFGSYRRVEMALGVADAARGLEAIAEKIAALVQPKPPRSVREMIVAARRFLPLLRVPPRSVRSGRCQEVVKLTTRGEVDLRRIPMIKCWPHDGDPRAVGFAIDAHGAGTAGGNGRFITFAGMHTIHADDRGVARPSSHNIGMYRSQLIDATHLAMHWHMHHDGAAHWRSWKALGERMPIAICFGGESVMIYGATAPLPPGLSELLMCGFLNGRGIPMVAAKTVPLRVPANSELVIEGWVDTRCGMPGWEPEAPDTDGRAIGAKARGSADDLGPGAVFEGPFGDHTGFYSLPDRYPIVEVTAITHARDAVIPATVVGPPPQEDYYLGKATERIFLPLLRTLIHDIEDYHLPLFGCFHNCAFVRITKAYPMQARRVMHSIWGAGQMAWTKMIVVVAHTVDVHDERAVWRAVFEHCHFGRDLECVHGPLDILDHAAPWLGAGSKIGFDATGAGDSEALHGVAAGAPRAPAKDAVTTMRAALARERPEAISAALPELIGAAVPEVGLGRLVVLAVRNDTRPELSVGSRRGAPSPQRAEPAALAGDESAATPASRAIDAYWKWLDDFALRVANGEAAARHLGDFMIVVDEAADLASLDDVLFTMCGNTDPGRDLHRRGVRIAIDATRKLAGAGRLGYPTRRFPARLSMDDATRQRVDARRTELGL